MKTPISIHISAVERLLSDSLINKKEYEDIMLRIVAKRVENMEGADNG